MSWKAILDRVQEELVPGTNGITVYVKFVEDGTRRETTREYNLTLGVNADMPSLEKLVTAQLELMEAQAPTRMLFEEKLGLEIQRSVKA